MKEILCSVTVKSIIQQGEEKEIIETYADGFFRLQADGADLFYKEKQEDAADDVKVRISFAKNENTNGYECRIHKEGAVNSDMLFIPHYETVSSYRTPFGTLHFDIAAKEVSFQTGEGGIKALLSYRLLDRGEVISDAEVLISAVRKTCPAT